MKTIAFISFPVAGHINPQFGLCEELSKRNVKLIYFTAERYRYIYKDNDNVIIKSYPKEFMEYWDELSNNSELTSKFMALGYVFNTFTEHILPFMMREIEELKPDLIISDALAVWGKACARHFSIPYTIFFSCFMGDSGFLLKNPAFLRAIIKSSILDFKYIRKATRIQKRIEKEYGKITDPLIKIMSHQDKFTMVATSKQFHPGGEDYPENVHFIRPSIHNDKPISVKKDTIFISVGTIVFSGSFWDICIEATKKIDYRVVISFGNNKKNSINTENVRSNVVVYDNLSLEDFRKELDRTEVFISHGGFNSITDGIIAETKLLVCPATAENMNNGKIIETYGCGKLFREKVTAQNLEIEINKLLKMDCKENIQKFKNSFIEEKTCKDVVDDLDKEFNILSK